MRLLQAQFLTHHELNPGFLIAANGLNGGLQGITSETVGCEDIAHFLPFNKG